MMSDDPMWKEFQPLWLGLQNAGKQILVAGGYGLFLKQHWQFTDRQLPTIVQLEDWRDVAPRVTKDLDLVIGLELLASAEAQRTIAEAMTLNGFNVVSKNPRWQFEKPIGQSKRILVDLHAELPASERRNLAIDKLRVKHKPSLADRGVHGRQNLQAAGCDYEPFSFRIGDTAIHVPNPVTWSVMKSVAMRDRWIRAADKSRDDEYRTFHREQAMKHAQDLTRVVAMTTRDESDRAADVINAIRDTDGFADAVESCYEFFVRDDGWGVQVATRMWRDDDFKIIRETLAHWLH